MPLDMVTSLKPEIVQLKGDEKRLAVPVLSKVFNQSAGTVEWNIGCRGNDDESASAVFAAVVEDFSLNAKQAVGAIQCAYYGGGDYWLTYLGVDPLFRNQGIARALVSRAEDYIRQNFNAANDSAREATILLQDETKITNPASQFYEKMGYAEKGVKWPWEKYHTLAKKVGAGVTP